MESFLLVVHVIVALVIVGLIMLQQGKGAEMGASFGSGGSQTVFGAVGSGNFFSRMTAIMVAVFFVTSFTLAVVAKRGAGVDESIMPIIEEQTEVVPSVPTEASVPTENSPAGSTETTAEAEPKDSSGSVSAEGEVPKSE